MAGERSLPREQAATLRDGEPCARGGLGDVEPQGKRIGGDGPERSRPTEDVDLLGREWLGLSGHVILLLVFFWGWVGYLAREPAR
jgi:hypothetical protein